MKGKLSIIFAIFIFLPVFSAHAQTPIKILLVPGHDNQNWGARYGNLKEADMNLALATKLFDLLKKDKRFDVHITRDSSGYTKEFSDYFTNNKTEINSFIVSAKEKTLSKISDGSFVQKPNTPHHAASEDVALQLYGINKWADENKMDALIHVHFDDYVRPSVWTMGKYKGFTVYMPDNQLANSIGSTPLATDIFKELKKKYITSTYAGELGGLITDQKLIALGANGTLNPFVRSVLIEYGYIYRFSNSSKRNSDYNTMANLTATGIKNYFFPKISE